MKYKSIFQIVATAVGLVFSSGLVAETPTAAMLANTCAGCHGTNGSSVGPSSPTIAGISRDYFIETMDAYRKDERPSTIMMRIAKGYSDQEIELMADFFSRQQFVRLDQKHNPQLSRKGAKLHKKFCEKCHEDDGRSAEDDAGILAGQWMPYLSYSMDDFISGKREMEKKMKKRLDTMLNEKGDESVEQLIQFYGSQQ